MIEELLQGLVNFVISQVLMNSVYLPFIMILSLVGLLMFRAHRNQEAKFNFYDIFVGNDGKASITSIARFCGYITLTWWFISLCAEGKAGAAEATVYGGLFVADQTMQRLTAMKSKQDETT